jgi:MFS family permease
MRAHNASGLVTSYAGLAIVRAFLGLIEGPMFPGIVLYLSYFYTREDLAVRVAFFFSTASVSKRPTKKIWSHLTSIQLSGAFSGLLAAGIENMNGMGGKAGWSWIFILEGIFSVLIGIIAFFLIPSSPRDSKFLTDAEKE